jgi:hypothetical protein
MSQPARLTRLRFRKRNRERLAGDVAVTMMTEGRGFADAKAELGCPSGRQGFKEELA